MTDIEALSSSTTGCRQPIEHTLPIMGEGDVLRQVPAEKVKTGSFLEEKIGTYFRQQDTK